MRRQLGYGFSSAALSEQESTIAQFVDDFIWRIGQLGVVNLTDWYNILTFDIIGALAFGESFEGIVTGWISTIR